MKTATLTADKRSYRKGTTECTDCTAGTGKNTSLLSRPDKIEMEI